jgi:hypothetical protein
MKMPKTTLTLICLTAVLHLKAQFQKGDWLLEGGIQTHLEGSVGKKEIDLSQGSFIYKDNDRFGWNASIGKFIRPFKEIGLAVEENWSRTINENYSVVQQPGPVRVNEAIAYDFIASLFFRRYFDLEKGWYGGFQIEGFGRYELDYYQVKEDGVEYPATGSWAEDFGIAGNLFVIKTLGKHFGGRVSFGNISWSLGTKSFAEGVWYSNFDLNLRNIINPNISIFWTFHGKRKNDRD